MTIQAYQTLYESSVAYGMRKALQAEQRKSEMLIKINQLNDNNDELESEVDDLRRKIESLLKQEKREKELGEKRHQDNLKSINDDNQVIKN
jgi:dynein light intermediate chain